MDNLTHSIAGLLVAEAALQWRPHASVPVAFVVRRSAYVAALITNNLPDLDFVYTGITPGRIGYLLHHRGHTHTLGIALLLGLATFAVLWALLRRSAEVTTFDRRRLFLLCTIGPWLHIGMDFSNNYGVHPLWPLSGRWFYGDAVFIVEPWFWVLALPPLIFAARKLWTRVALSLPLAAGLGLAWTLEMVPWGAALALTFGAVLGLIVAGRSSERRRVLQGLLGCAAFLLICVVSSKRARATISAEVQRAEPALSIVDVALSPAPANPLCFSAILVGTHGDRYVLRSAVVAAWPILMSALDCRTQPSEPTARLRAITSSAGNAVRWRGEWSAPLAELRSLGTQSCEAAALLRFARTPYWLAPTNQRRLVGDLRYDTSPGRDFADVDVKLDSTPDGGSSCPPFVPSWEPPLRTLLVPR